MKRKLEEILDYVQPAKFIVSSEIYSNNFKTPVLTPGKTFLLGYTDEEEGIYNATKDNPIILFDDFTTDTKWVDFSFKVKSSACKILVPKEKINLKYVHYALKKVNIDTSSHKRYWISFFSQEYINVPTLDQQETIVKNLEGINSIIQKNKSLLDKIDELIDAKFSEITEKIDEYQLIGDLISICRGASPRPINQFITKDVNGVNWIKIGDVDENSLYITSTEEKITREGALRSRFVKPGDFILSNSMSYGRPYILGINGCVHDGWLILSDYDKVFEPIFLYYAIRSKEIQNQFNGKAKGTTVRNLNSDLVKNTKIKVVPKNVQNEFVEFTQRIDELKILINKRIEKYKELLDKKMDEYFK